MEIFFNYTKGMKKKGDVCEGQNSVTSGACNLCKNKPRYLTQKRLKNQRKPAIKEQPVKPVIKNTEILKMG